MKKFIGLALLSTLLVAGGEVASVYEDTPSRLTYVGATFNINNTFSRDDSNTVYNSYLHDSFTDGGVGLQAGYVFQEYDEAALAVEGRLATSLFMEDTEDISLITYGAYLKPIWRANYVLGIYGLLGFNGASYSDGYYSVDYSGLSGGVGASLKLDPSVKIFTDVTYTDLGADIGLTGESDLTQWVVGVNYAF